MEQETNMHITIAETPTFTFEDAQQTVADRIAIAKCHLRLIHWMREQTELTEELIGKEPLKSGIRLHEKVTAAMAGIQIPNGLGVEVKICFTEDFATLQSSIYLDKGNYRDFPVGGVWVQYTNGTMVPKTPERLLIHAAETEKQLNRLEGLTPEDIRSMLAFSIRFNRNSAQPFDAMLRDYINH